MSSKSVQSLKNLLAAAHKKHVTGKDSASLELEDLYQTLDIRREQFGLSWSQVAAQCEVAPSVLIRMAQGVKSDAESLEKIKKWVNSRDGLWVKL